MILRILKLVLNKWVKFDIIPWNLKYYWKNHMPKSFISARIILQAILLSVFGALILAGCSKSDDQKAFEQKAFAPPDTNIVQTNQSGEILDNNDPDDWRVSPRYQTLITVGLSFEFQPPYPNPVNFNSKLYIHLRQNSPDVIDGLEIRTIDEDGDINQVIFYNSDQIGSYNIDKQIEASSIVTGRGDNASGFYRLLIYDGRNNLITYGDVKIMWLGISMQPSSDRWFRAPLLLARINCRTMDGILP